MRTISLPKVPIAQRIGAVPVSGSRSLADVAAHLLPALRAASLHVIMNQGIPRNAYVRVIDVSDRLWQRVCSTASIHMHKHLRGGGATGRQLRSLPLALTCAGQLEIQLSSARLPAGPSQTDAIEFMLLLHDLIQERF